MVAALLLAVAVTGVSIRNAVVKQQNITRAEGIVAGLLKADIAQAPAIISEMEPYRRRAFELAVVACRQGVEVQEVCASGARLRCEPRAMK